MHVLRHTAAMQLLHAGVDISVIAPWLGHERIDTTHIYLHADLALEERALARITPPNITPGVHRAVWAVYAVLIKSVMTATRSDQSRTTSAVNRLFAPSVIGVFGDL